MTIYEELADQLVRKAIEKTAAELVRNRAEYGREFDGQLRSLMKEKCEAILNEPDMQHRLRERLKKAIDALPETLTKPTDRWGR